MSCSVPGLARLGDRGDIGGHISTEPRINDRIRVPEVRLVGPSGEQVGIVSITDALRLAQEADLDLVEVAPTARPPVCKLMDFGKFKYESALKARESRKNQAQTVIKEIKIRPKIDPHDYGTKKGHVERFLRQGDKVKVTIMFRGREQSRPELGYRLLQRLAGDVEELGFVESQPKQDGRNMIMVIGPHRKKTDAKAARAPERASARASAPTASQGRAASATPRTAAPARPASRPASASSGSSSPRPEPPRSTAAGSPRPASGSGQAAPRPTPPRPGPGASGSAGAAGSASPKPAPPASGARPSAPKPGPSGAARPATPRPSAPRAAAKPGEGRPVPTTPRARAAEPTSAEQRAAGAEAGG
ncbi:MAG: translation initiation factor IF-3 [Streptosporangiaceae bacterium]